MTTAVFLSIIVFVCLVIAVVLVYLLLEIRRAVRKLEDFISTSRSSLIPTLDELPGTVKSIRRIADNMSVVTEDVKTLSGSVREVGENIRQTSAYIEGIASSSSIQISGLKAAVRVGLNTLMNNLMTKHRK